MIIDIILGVLFLALAIGLYMIAKNEVTFRNHSIITNAVCTYRLDMLDKDQYEDCVVDFIDIEDYNTTLLRLWDWSYKRLLPPEKFEVIKPYISKAKGGNS